MVGVNLISFHPNVLLLAVLMPGRAWEKLIMCRDIRWVDVWMSGQQVTVALISITGCARLSGRHQTVFECFLGSESRLTAVQLQTTAGHGVEVWSVTQSFCTAVGELSGPKKCHQDCLMGTAHLLCGPYLQLLVCSLEVECATLAHVHQHPGTSLHMMNFTRPSPALVLQATNARAKRPGYERLG